MEKRMRTKLFQTVPEMWGKTEEIQVFNLILHFVL